MNITDYFKHNFEIVPVNTDDLLEEVLQLRYQVFCIETTILNKRNHTDCREQDLYDNRSAHCLIQHKGTGIFVASVRLVLPDPENNLSSFPIEHYCSESFFKDAIIVDPVKRKTLGEVSRILVSKEREQRIKEYLDAYTDKTDSAPNHGKKDGLRCYLLLFGLFSAVMKMTAENNILMWYVSVTPILLRLLNRFEIHFTPIGTPIDYNGTRIPCLGSTEIISSLVCKYRPELWRFVTRIVTPTKMSQGIPVSHTPVAGPDAFSA